MDGPEHGIDPRAAIHADSHDHDGLSLSTWPGGEHDVSNRDCNAQGRVLAMGAEEGDNAPVRGWPPTSGTEIPSPGRSRWGGSAAHRQQVLQPRHLGSARTAIAGRRSLPAHEHP